MRKWILVLLAVLLPLPLFAVDPGWVVEQAVLASASQKALTGLEFDTSAMYTIPLTKTDDALWKDNKIAIGVLNGLTPAYNQTFLYIDIIPIAIFELKVKAGAMPIYNIGMSWGWFPLANPDFSTTNSGTGSSKFSWWIKALPTLKIPLGWIYGGRIDQLALVDTLEIDASFVPGYDGYYIDWYSGAYGLKGPFDWYLYNDTYLLFQAIPDQLMVGGDFNILCKPNQTGNYNLPEYRPSAVAIWTPQVDWAHAFYLAVLAGHYLATPSVPNNFYFGIMVGANWKVF
jgi:hypothetical protein